MNRLKFLRRKKHLTQQQLSKELKKRNIKVSVALISSYEQEKIPFNKEKLQKIANYFDVSVNYLTGRWSPVNKIDNLNRDFFVLCHD
nr:helix-turn-helix transcriptional regulator [Limosilactobacillus reuteri]